MNRTTENGDVVLATPATRWQRAADRLARYAWLILLVSVAIALLGGVVSALVWQPDPDGLPAEAAECETPPCFGGGGLPGLQDLPWAISMVGYGLAILLGLPSLLAGAWDLLRGRGAVGARRFLVFVGPLLVFVGIELLPHLLNPCTIPYQLGSRDLPGICQTDPEWGADVEDRYHLLDHALVGALPMVALYWWVLRKWRPAVARLQ